VRSKNVMLSIIIPAYNGQSTIATTLKEYMRHFSAQYGQDFEIVVIPNGCTDATTRIVRDYVASFPQVTAKEFESRIGKGGAVIEGFRIASGDVVAFTDADGATTPEELQKLVDEIETCDGTIGSRWARGARVVVRQSLRRRVASRGFNLLVKLLLGLPFNDTQCGAKVFRKNAIDSVLDRLQVTNFAFDVELLYRLAKNGYRIKEVPIEWEDKDGSTLNLRKVVPAMFLAVLRLRLTSRVRQQPAKAASETTCRDTSGVQYRTN
jgi:dolichol-phosphate mannosyltransferase